jgi:hypothetical protein
MIFVNKFERKTKYFNLLFQQVRFAFDVTIYRMKMKNPVNEANVQKRI